MKPEEPKDFYLTYSRDFTFLSTCLIAAEMVRYVEAYIGISYDQSYFIHRNGQIDFYRSEADEARFTHYVGEKALHDPAYLKHACETLAALTDQLSLFFKAHSALTAGNIDEFLELHRKHMAYHLFVYWAGDYVGALPEAPEHEGARLRLYEARTYNERILPDFETWLLPQKAITLLTESELRAYLEGGMRPDTAELAARNEYGYVYMDKKTIHVSSGTEAREDFKEIAECLNAQGKAGFHGVLHGTGACKGTHVGIVQNIRLPEGFRELKPGNVLVTGQTRPHYNAFLRNAGAIVVDEGAFLGHAVILAREFNIPTVIGTRFGSEVLKDGDRVEVDGVAGTVTVLN